jgi:hypothetical protein
MWPATCMRPYGSTCMRVSPAQFDTVPGAPRDGRPVTAQLATAAAAVTRFEAETAPHIAAEAPTPASLEDLRLQTPALRPVGCWWLGYACAASGRMRACSTAPVNARKALLHERVMYAQVPGPVRRDGGGPAAAAVLRLQHRALLLRGVPEGGLARGPQGRVPAPASAPLTGAAAWQICVRAP